MNICDKLRSLQTLFKYANPFFTLISYSIIHTNTNIPFNAMCILYSATAPDPVKHTLSQIQKKRMLNQKIPSSTPKYQIHSQRQHISFCLIWRNKYKKSEVLPSCRRLANIYLVLFFISYSSSKHFAGAMII